MQPVKPKAVFSDYELKRIKEALKQMIKGFRKIGLHPKYDISGNEIFVLIDLDELAMIVKNRVTSAVNPYKGMIDFNIFRDEKFMKVVVRVER